MKWLFSRPLQNVVEALEQFEALVRFDTLGDNNFMRKYDPVIPYFIEPFIYPVKFIIPLWLALTLAALIATWKHAWKINPLWGIYILTCLPILPHLFIAWYGDAMHPQRHALAVGLQLALCFWTMIFLLCDQFAARWKTHKIESYV
jgi:hypothetical protein